MEKHSSYDHYVSPLSSRYVSAEMSYLFSPRWRILTFRSLWVALADAERELGLPITEAQVAAMRKAAGEIDFAKAREYEKMFRHDVMAHIHAFSDVCPEAKGVIHLGATSSYVTDNSDLLQMREAFRLLWKKMVGILDRLAKMAKRFAKEPTLSYTHFQAAQPTTVGKRACLWLQDFYHDALDWQRLEGEIPFLGVKGATGTQGSFLALFEGDEKKVKELEKRVAKTFGFTKILPIAGQTYSRKIDLSLLNALESFAASAHKMGTDLRLLAHEEEIQEGFEEKQVGSSAMPHKKNPIYAERICGLARFLISLAQNPAYTAATQWLERSLDDSSNRRLSIPEAFLTADAILNLLAHLLDHLHVDVDTAKSHILEKLPFLAMENTLMKAAQKGGDRQEIHETLRELALELRKEKEPEKYFIEKAMKKLNLSEKEVKSLLNIHTMIGRSASQVEDFLSQEIEPYVKMHREAEAAFPKIEI